VRELVISCLTVHRRCEACNEDAELPFKMTHEEMHSTRGRARLPFEMLQGNPLSKGWPDEHVKEALDLCHAPGQDEPATSLLSEIAHSVSGLWELSSSGRLGGVPFSGPGVGNFFGKRTPAGWWL
jgi:hypothetical protein